MVSARFQDITGLDVPLGTPRKTVTLRRGGTVGPGLRKWRSEGSVPPKNGCLVMLDAASAEKGRWNFRAGRISKWVGAGLHAKGSGDVAITVLELACESLDEA